MYLTIELCILNTTINEEVSREVDSSFSYNSVEVAHQ